MLVYLIVIVWLVDWEDSELDLLIRLPDWRTGYVKKLFF